MRLTLRTLLAYLDDTLDPAESKAIGRKIAESSTAQELIGRIREVVRRRRITAPPVDGPGAKSDADLVAEYIENLLPAEELAAVEETCLNDEVYLAEMAACHQILTVVLSEPARVPPMTRQRMYGLIQGPEAIPYRRARRPAADRAVSKVARDPDETEDMLLMGLPFYRTQSGWLRRLAPYGLVLLGMIIVGAIWLVLPWGREKIRSRNEQRAAANSRVNVAPVPPNPATDASTPKSTGDQDPRPSGATPEKTEGAAADAPMPVASDPPNEKKPEGTNPTATNPPSASAPPPAKGERKAVGKHVAAAGGESSVLLQRGSGQTTWQRVPIDASINSEEELLSLPGCRSRVELNRGISLILWGAVPGDGAPMPLFESTALLHSGPDVDADLTLLRGRLSIQNIKKEGSARARVRFRGQSMDITLEPAAQVAVELFGVPLPEYVKDARAESAPAAMTLCVLKGQVEVRFESRTFSMNEPPGPGAFAWTSWGGPSPSPQLRSTLPPWASLSIRSALPQVAQMLDKLQARLQAGTPVEETIVELVKGKDPIERSWGIRVLGATDNLPLLLDEMANENSAGDRRLAIEAVMYWMAQGGPNTSKLYAALEKKYGIRPAEIIMHLLHGFSAEARKKPETYEQLIEYLKHDKLTIRELAWNSLLLMEETREIAKAIPFDPAGGVDQRTSAYERWKSIVPDGKLPPKDLPPTPGGSKKKDK